MCGAAKVRSVTRAAEGVVDPEGVEEGVDPEGVVDPEGGRSCGRQASRS